MRKGFKLFVILLVVAILVMMFGPALMMAFQGGHP